MTRKSRQKPKIVGDADQNFDLLAAKFQSQIHGTLKGEIRLEVLKRELQHSLLRSVPQGARVLDLGGGAGQTALLVAQSGYAVDLVDVSQVMLDQALELFKTQGLSSRLRTFRGSLQEWSQTQLNYPLVLCHAVLEWLENPQQALEDLLKSLPESACLSLMFFNRYGLEMHHLLLGNLDHYTRGLPAKKTNTTMPLRAYFPDEVESWIQQVGWKVRRKIGVRVLHDYLRDRANALVQKECSLIDMELRLSDHPLYWQMGRYVHFEIVKDENDE